MSKYNRKIRIVSNIVLFAMTLLCVLPLILLVTSSFTAEEVLAQNGYSFFPQKWGAGRLSVPVGDTKNFASGL